MTDKYNIHVQYSGFIIFGSQVASMVTGLIFIILLTRNMSISQFGIYNNMFDYSAYFLFFISVVPFWVTRFIARGKTGTVRTSIAIQAIIGGVATLSFLPVIVLISEVIHTTQYLPIYLISSMYIFTTYMLTVFEGILTSIKPQITGYGVFIEGIAKVAVAGFFILVLKQIFLGAVLGLITSSIAQIGYYSIVLREELKEKADWSYLGEWLKGSVATIYYSVGNQLMSVVMIMLFVLGGSVARGYYQAAASFTNIVAYSIFLAFALYPKLLSDASEKIETSFKTILMFAIPLSVIVIVMSKSFLAILNTNYISAYSVVIVLTIDVFIGLIYAFYSKVIMGIDEFDEDCRISLRKFTKSKVFVVFTFEYIQAAIAIPITYFVLTRMSYVGMQATIAVIGVVIFTNFVTFVWLYAKMRKFAKLPFVWHEVTKYLYASLIMGVALMVYPTFTITLTILKVTVGFLIYAGILLAIDKQARNLVKVIVKEIKTICGIQ